MRRVRDRPACVAPSAGPSRPLGLRSAGGAGAREHQSRRPQHQSGRAGHQAGVCVRLRSDQRAAGLADRGAAGAAIEHAGRADVGDAAVSNQTAAVRTSRRHGGRFDRFHARASRGGARHRETLRDRTVVYPALDQGAAGDQGDDSVAGVGGRCRLAGRCVRSRHRHPVRRVNHRPLRRRHRAG